MRFFYFEISKRKYCHPSRRLTPVQDVAHSFCTEAEIQMRIADRRIFLKKTNQLLERRHFACVMGQRAPVDLFWKEHKWEITKYLELSIFDIV